MKEGTDWKIKNTCLFCGKIEKNRSPDTAYLCSKCNAKRCICGTCFTPFWTKDNKARCPTCNVATMRELTAKIAELHLHSEEPKRLTIKVSSNHFLKIKNATTSLP